jgi:chitin synthase
MALRFQNNYDFTDVPIPTTKQPPRSGATVRRAKTLTKPERSVAPVPLINPPSAHHAPTASTPSKDDDYHGSTTWRIFSQVVTFWAPSVLLSSLGGLKDAPVRQAWREKVTLCFIIALLCGGVGFATVGFQKVLCPDSNQSDARYIRVGTSPNTLSIHGRVYNVSSAQASGGVDFRSLAAAANGQDITALFQREASNFPACNGLTFRAAVDPPCSTSTPCSLPLPSNASLTALGIRDTGFESGYDWEQVSDLRNYLVLDGAVLNLTPYLLLHTSAVPGDKIDTAIRTVMQYPQHGKDGTYLFMGRSDLKAALPCLKERYLAGNIDKITPGCYVSSLFLYAGLIVILALVLVRFAMACVFNWFLSERLAGPPTAQELARSAISPAVMPGGANLSVDNKNGTAPWSNPNNKLTKAAKSARSIASSSSATLTNPEGPSPIMSLQQIGAELFAVCLVTCYSEGEESLRTTLDSISNTTYSDARKLLFIIADGMITGAGEKRSTPDICVSLLEADPRFGNPIPMSYPAVGSGAKANNRAMVYAGHYSKSIALPSPFLRY